MSAENCDQTPLLNFNFLDLFDLKINPKCNDWDKFLEDFLLIRYNYFRSSFQAENVDFVSFFLNLVEGNFLVLKSDLVCESLSNMKRVLMDETIDSTRKMQEMIPDYLQVVNLGRIVIVYLIMSLYNVGVKLNNENVQKFMKIDADLDTTEKPSLRSKIMSFTHIKSMLPKDNSKIDYRGMIDAFISQNKEKNECIIF